ncbi:hypothetical protein MLD38_027814 [Melastoma candidum]|uniref:Uncharacterized protein n=1 Tax=Melastoma candidum TaxID=119954 RepID=A0ACB9P2Q8_9MYRT|nr:hypothetical protein MLD38_027814 [Melastoma candidum]
MPWSLSWALDIFSGLRSSSAIAPSTVLDVVSVPAMNRSKKKCLTWNTCIVSVFSSQMSTNFQKITLALFLVLRPFIQPLLYQPFDHLQHSAKVPCHPSLSPLKIEPHQHQNEVQQIHRPFGKPRGGDGGYATNGDLDHGTV